MTAILAQLVAVGCAELGVPPQITGVVTNAVLQLVSLIPEKKIEAALFAVGRRAVALLPRLAHWLATRPPAEWGDPDMGGNVPAAFGSGPPVETRPEPDEGATLGGNVPAIFGSAPPDKPRPEPEGTRDPGDPGT